MKFGASPLHTLFDVKNAFQTRGSWVDTFVTTTGHSRLYPGAVGNLDEVSGVRTYNPTVQPWYTGTLTNAPAVASSGRIISLACLIEDGS